jgi:putative ABC transport system permease protein
MQDLRAAFRALTARPGFTIVAIATLALGIGANTAVYTAVHGVLLRPLPYSNADDVVVLNEVSPQFANPISVSWQNYVDWRDRNRSFEALAAFRTTQMTLTGSGEPQRLPARMITTTLLPMLRVTLPLGRNFTHAEDRAGAPAVAILSHGLWVRDFNASPDVLGRRVQLDNRPATIVGILPPDFELFQLADIYVPMGPWAATLPDDRGWHPGILPIGRMRAGTSIDDARAEMERIATQLEAEHPQFNRNVRARVTRLQDVVVQNVRPALLVLLGAVSLVLLIACANVANLLLARAVGRQKEIAVRTAIGGSRSRIVRQLVVESLVLSCLGGAAGVLLASWSVEVLGGMVTGVPRAAGIAVNVPVLIFAVSVSIVTGLVFGMAPAFQATRFDIREALNEEGRGMSGGGVSHQRMRSGLVVAEVALALVLLVGAGLMLGSFASLQRVAAGFDTTNLLLVDLPLSPTTYRDDQVRTAVVDRMVARLQALPGITGVAMTTAPPMAGAGATIHFHIAGRPPSGPEEYKLAGYRAVTPGYFETMGIPLRRGRTLDVRDRQGAPLVAVINDAMAQHYFSDVDPIGQRFAIGTEPDGESAFIEIVGVVGDVLQTFELGARAEYYLPYGQHPHPVLAGMYRNLSLAARATSEVTSLVPSVRAAIREIDADQPLVRARTMEQAIADTVAQPRLQATLLTVFASVALALAMIGVYGVMACAVSQRTQEIGVRVALGASHGDVVRMVVGQAARLAAAGIALGLVGAVLLTRVMTSLLVETSGRDPLTFAGAAALLGGATLLASYIPARRAATVAPTVALGR